MNQLAAMEETVWIANERGMPNLPGNDLGLDHLRTMLFAMNTEPMSDSKMGRWLGWAQCAVVAADIGLTLDDMKHINRRWDS